MKHKDEKVATATTKDNVEQHQQQILFTDNDVTASNTDPLVDQNEQIIFSNQQYIDTETSDDYSVVTDGYADELGKDSHKLEQYSSSRSWLWPLMLILLLTIVGFELVDFFISGFNNSPILTSIYAILLSCLLLVTTSAVINEYATIRQFKRLQKVKKQANCFLVDESKQTDSVEQVEQLCQKISNNLPCDLISEQEQAWQDALSSSHSSQELVQLYSRLVLKKVDDKALQEVAKFSNESVILVALSPVAIVDMLIMVWRNIRMVNKIAGLYGIKLGYWSRIKLIKQVFINMVYAGASELIADFGTDILGAELLGKLSGRLAQGIGAGMLTARLGIKTMQLCRPLPFDRLSAGASSTSYNSAPKLAQVRREMLITIKKLVIDKSSN